MESVTWQCPACWETLDAAGPALMRLAIAMHIQDKHERKPTPDVEAKPSEVYDHAFYAGDRLTAYDKGRFLAPMHVEWGCELPLAEEPK